MENIENCEEVVISNTILKCLNCFHIEDNIEIVMLNNNDMILCENENKKVFQAEIFLREDFTENIGYIKLCFQNKVNLVQPQISIKL